MSSNGRSDLKPTNPKDRVATSRLDLSLFPDTATAYGALGMTEGDAKYGGYNYRVGGVLASVYYAAARRHLAKWYNGEWADRKTGVPHLGSALACIAILVDAVECGVLKDDRPPVCDMDNLLVQFEALTSSLHQLFPSGPGRFTEVSHGASKRTELLTEEVATLRSKARRAASKKVLPSVLKKHSRRGPRVDSIRLPKRRRKRKLSR